MSFFNGVTDVIEVLHETTDGSYMVYSHNDECTYQMRRADLETQEAQQLVDVIWDAMYA